MVVSGPTVNGSLITPASNFLTRATSAAWRSTDMFLCMMPMPPSWAIAIGEACFGDRVHGGGRRSAGSGAGRGSGAWRGGRPWAGRRNAPGRGRHRRRSVLQPGCAAWAGPGEKRAIVTGRAGKARPCSWERRETQVVPASATVCCLCRLQCVLHQGRDRHRPDPARHRRDPAGALGRRLEADVADQPAIVEPVDADVDDDRAGLHPFAGHQPRAARPPPPGCPRRAPRPPAPPAA